MTSLKRLDTLFALATPKEEGLLPVFGIFYRETRHCSLYEWILPDCVLLFENQERLSRLESIYSSRKRHGCDFSIHRSLGLERDGFFDRLELRNYSPRPRRFDLALRLDCDFRDLMALRLSPLDGRDGGKEVRRPEPLSWTARTEDGVELETRFEFSRPSQGGEDGTWRWSIEVEPGQGAELLVRGRFTSSLAATGGQAKRAEDWQDFQGFRRRFAALEEEEGRFSPLVETALRDLHGLLHEREGFLVLAAGLPYFDAPFGRDSLISASFLLDFLPELARDTLRLAARLQGRAERADRLEEEGKIFHETREGELSRRGLIPYALYYGSIDSTPLFILLLEKYVSNYHESAKDRDLLKELEPAWRAALDWLLRKLAAGRGFLRFVADAAKTGLKVQSWKDSADSLLLPDGSPARGAIAVGEVQAKAYGALLASERLAAALGDAPLAEVCRLEARALALRIRETFWMAEETCYALALDGEDRLLRDISSDAGHFFGIALESEEEARRMAARLLQPDLFSGWGLRCLSSSSPGYNPLSYHRGSVWPHDNALVALGMASRGLREEASLLAGSMLEALDLLPGKSAPELLAGFSRDEIAYPVSHPFSCKPQAWSAAGVIAMEALLRTLRDEGAAEAARTRT